MWLYCNSVCEVCDAVCVRAVSQVPFFLLLFFGSLLHRVLVHLGDLVHRDGGRHVVLLRLVGRFGRGGRRQHGGALLLVLHLLFPLLLFPLAVQQAVVDAHPDEEDHARDDEDDAGGDVGVVVVFVVGIE